MTVLAVIGVRDLRGREFRDFRLVSSELDRYLGWIDEVVSGGARGSDKMGVRWAQERGLPFREFLPDFAAYGRPMAYFVRNRHIANACDLMVAFWDGLSRGTRDAIDYTERLGKPVDTIRL